jgi:long-subunit fatty acid transport protein
MDLAWSHIFVDDGKFDRDTLAPDLVPTASTNIQGHVKSSIDIISVGLKTKF